MITTHKSSRMIEILYLILVTAVRRTATSESGMNTLQSIPAFLIVNIYIPFFSSSFSSIVMLVLGRGERVGWYITSRFVLSLL